MRTGTQKGRVTAAPRPLATPQLLTTGQALLEYLKLEGVCRIFGIPGGAAGNLLVNIKDRRDDFTFVICRHETGACYMADGYYRATGRMGVVLVTSGPGATNALTGAVNAENGGTPLIVITGEVPRQFFGKGYLQEGIDTELNIDAIYEAAVTRSLVIGDACEFQTLVEIALRESRSIPRSAVHISLPNDVAASPLGPAFQMPVSTASYRTVPRGARDEDVSAALDMLRNAERPLIFLGNGCREALRDPACREGLKRFVEHHAIPVATTADGKGIFPESHPMSLRNYGFASCRWPGQWMAPAGGAHYDGLLVIGSALLGLATENWNPRISPNGPLIQVDLHQHAIWRAVHVTQGIVAEAGAFISSLAAMGIAQQPDSIKADSRRKALADIHKTSPYFHPEQYESESSPIQPAALVRVLQKTLPRDKTMILLDAGNCVAWGAHYFAIDPPAELQSSLAMGPMGFAVGAVVGARMGRPDFICVALTGDGAFLMHGAEVSTAQAYGIGAIWVVLQDDDLRMVTQGQEYFFPDPHGHRSLRPTFCTRSGSLRTAGVGGSLQ